MDKSKVLFLVETDPSNIFIDDLKENGYNVELFFKDVNIAFRFFRRIWLKIGLPGRIWLNNWFKDLNKEVLIINVNRLNHKLFKEIKNKYPEVRIIGWYWNTVEENNKPLDFTNVEYWSFDDDDCKKYGFKKNIQYYSYPKITDMISKDIDIYFVGRAKGRSEQIFDFKKQVEKQSLNCDFNVVEGNDIIPYSEVKEKLLRSKAVLEINKEKQTGYTLRTLESLFFGIKLITNNENILNAPFYNENNIFVIGKDNDEKLLDFINSKYDYDVDKFKSDYDINKWFNNFFEE